MMTSTPILDEIHATREKILAEQRIAPKPTVGRK